MESLCIEVCSKSALLHALVLSRNAMVPHINIEYRLKEKKYVLASHRQQLLKEMEGLVNSVFNSYGGSYANSQLSGVITEFVFGLHKLNMKLQPSYFNSSGETNRLRCLAAAVARELLEEDFRQIIDKDISDKDKIRSFFGWLKRNFRYTDNGLRSDHSSYDLVRRGTGVCQAISGLACLVLSYMGIPTLFIAGCASNSHNVGGHAWNAVFIKDNKKGFGKWCFLDFTFGLTRNSPSIPNRNTHFWNKNHYSLVALQRKIDLIEASSSGLLELTANSNKCKLKDVTVTVPYLFLKCTSSGLKVNLKKILLILGGGYHFNKFGNEVFLCLHNKGFSVKGASAYLFDKSGWCSIQVLERLAQEFGWNIGIQGKKVFISVI